MRKIRVLIVDDAVVVRRMVSDILSQDPMLEVAGVAANGRIALAKIEQVNPDVVTLDVEMPEMDGLETLAEIRKRHPLLPVIMFSTLTERGAAAALDALTLGANDYVTKPANVGSVTITIQHIHASLIPKIKTFCPKLNGSSLWPGAANVPAPIAVPEHRMAEKKRVDILVIGVSTGGPNALGAFLPALPADFPIPVLIVQHMPPVFTKLLAERLSAKSALHVEEAKAGAPLKPGCAWVAPGDYHIIVARENGQAILQTHQAPPENSCRPSVDVLFRSVAETFGGHTLAIVMTGMGRDGLRGCEDIREAGGRILAQDEATSVVWGMPGFVAQAGLADRVLPLTQLPHETIRSVGASPCTRRGEPRACPVPASGNP